MKKDKIIILKDVINEISNNLRDIVSLENEIEKLKLRQQYLNAVEDYLRGDCIQPYIKGKLLIDDFELEKFALPLIMKDKIQLLENQIAFMKCSKRGKKK